MNMGIRYPEWIQVTEQLPPAGPDVLVTDGTACMVASLCAKTKTFDFFDNGTIWKHDHVTHWMPLPESPEKIQHRKVKEYKCCE